MCKEAFQKCLDYLDKNIVAVQKTGRLSDQDVKFAIGKVVRAQDLLNQRLPDFRTVETLVNEIKDRLFAVLMGKNLNVQQGDITAQSTDAIVNAANDELYLGEGVAGAINRAGGPQIQIACDVITNDGKSPLEIGKVATTTGGNLQPVIHAAVMPLGGQATFNSIRRATRNIVLEAKAKGFKSLAIPALGAGFGGVSPKESARAIKKGLYDVVLDLAAFDEIKIVTSDPKIQETFQQIFTNPL